MSLAKGDKLGPYEIIEPIGKGGMGEVYRAHDSRVGRDVAIKTSAEQFSERFSREVRAIAALNHPNICHLYDVGPNFLVMELVEGETLAERIKSGAIPLEESLHIARQIGDALEAAHEKGITHRDLKPGNIKIKPDGTVKVLDFGLAKISPAEAGPTTENSPTLSMTATLAGVVLGTAAYMAPEQAKGKPVDKRADIWAFAVVLYEMLTGRRMFEAEDLTETLASVVMKQPELDSAPIEVRRLLRKCLEKDPKKRLRDIGDAWELLVQEPGLRPSTPGVGYLWPSIAAVAILLGAALAFVHFRERPFERQPLQYTLPLPEKVTAVREFAISPDGRYVVMEADGEGGQRLWVRALDSLQAQALPGTGDATYPFWSPDSRYIGFFAGDKLKKISLNGGPSQVLCEAINARGGSWSRAGVILFAVANGSGGLMRVSEMGGEPTVFTKPNSGTYRWPLFLPDGQRFLYMANGGKTNGIFLASLESKEARRVAPDQSTPGYVAPSTHNSSGLLLFVREQTLMAQPVDSQTFDNKGELFPAAEFVSRGPANGSFLFSLSENGTLIYRKAGAEAGRQHVWFDKSGTEKSKAGGVMQSNNQFSISLDRKRLATERVAPSGSGSDIWITDLDHDGADSRFTFDPSFNSFPIWSPDGSRIVFGTTRNAGIGLYTRLANNTGQEDLLFESKDLPGPTPLDWSRDGKYIIFRTNAGNGDLYALPLSGDKKPIPLAARPEFNETQGQISPDGRWLAYSTTESGSFKVVVIPFTPGLEKPLAGKWQISTGDGGVQPRWRDDSKELYYMATGKLMAVDINATAQSFNHSTPHRLFDSRADQPSAVINWSYVPDRDGMRFLIAVPAGATAEAPPITVVVNWLGTK